MKQTTENNWSLGEVTTLPMQEKLLKESGTNSYAHYVGSRYICIREAAGSQQGILMKVLGKVRNDQILLVNGKPFCTDDSKELFEGIRYYSYPFPTASQVMEALGIIRANPELLQKFEGASMHVNTDSTFWVSDTLRYMLLQKKLQYLSGRNGQLYPAKTDGWHYRVTFVYFHKGELIL